MVQGPELPKKCESQGGEPIPKNTLEDLKCTKPGNHSKGQEQEQKWNSSITQKNKSSANQQSKLYLHE